MAKKKKKSFKIPVLTVIGVVATFIFYLLFGLEMLLRYFLGAVMLGTITATIIDYLNKKYKGKYIVK